MGLTGFEGCTVWITPRSPFARRVRIALLENQISFHEKICDVFHPSKDLTEVNPLARVPTVQLEDGQVLIDSHLILQSFYERAESALYPKDLSERREMYRWSAVATGLCDKTVEFYIDTLRPKNHQDPEVSEELSQIVGRVLSALETYLSKSKEGWIVSRFSQADVDMGAALNYLCLRYSSEWKNRFSQCARYLEKLNLRPSFERTQPPA